jgi:hypothetical protein
MKISGLISSLSLFVGCALCLLADQNVLDKPVAQAAPPVAATISSPIRMAAAADTGSIKSIRADEAVFMD